MTASINPYEPPREIAAVTRLAELPRPIRVAGRISWDDALDAQRLAMQASKRLTGKRRASVSYFWILWTVFLFGASAAMLGAPGRAGSYVYLGVVLAIGALVYYPRLRLRREWKRGSGMFAPSERILTQEGIERISAGVATTIPWSEFSSFKRSRQNVLLYPASHGGSVVFPRAMFPSEDDWQDFVDFVQTRFPQRI
jgi:hypothetical protein